MALFEWPESDGRVRLAISTGVLIALATAIDWTERRFCSPQHWARDLAGASAADCGEFGASEDRASAIDCMLRAQAEGRPAHAVLWEFGIDSAIAHVFVRTANGKALMLDYDSDRSGGLRLDPHLARRQCSRFQEEKREMAFNVRHSLECLEASAFVDVCGSE